MRGLIVLVLVLVLEGWGENTDRTYGTYMTYRMRLFYPAVGRVLIQLLRSGHSFKHEPEHDSGSAKRSHLNDSRGIVRRFWWFCRMVFSASTPLK